MSTNIERAAGVIGMKLPYDAANALATEGLLVTDEPVCDGSYQCPANEHIQGCFLSKPEVEQLTDEQARLIERGREAERQDDEVRAWTKKHGPVNIANISAAAEEQARLIADFRRIGSEIHARRNGRTEYALAGLIDELAVVLSRADAIYAERETP